jgi:hypothetical protein
VRRVFTAPAIGAFTIKARAQREVIRGISVLESLCILQKKLTRTSAPTAKIQIEVAATFQFGESVLVRNGSFVGSVCSAIITTAHPYRKMFDLPLASVPTGAII